MIVRMLINLWLIAGVYGSVLLKDHIKEDKSVSGWVILIFCPVFGPIWLFLVILGILSDLRSDIEKLKEKEQ